MSLFLLTDVLEEFQGLQAMYWLVPRESRGRQLQQTDWLALSSGSHKHSHFHCWKPAIWKWCFNSLLSLASMVKPQQSFSEQRDNSEEKLSPKLTSHCRAETSQEICSSDYDDQVQITTWSKCVWSYDVKVRVKQSLLIWFCFCWKFLLPANLSIFCGS